MFYIFFVFQFFIVLNFNLRGCKIVIVRCCIVQDVDVGSCFGSLDFLISYIYQR